VIPTSPVLGAEITGIDLSRNFGDREYQFVNEALLKHRVIVLRNQNLSDDDLLAFSRRFGTLDKAPPNENGKQFVPGYEEIYVISNVIENGVAIGALGAGEASWHTDMSFLPDPPLGSVLYSLEVPPSGGDTWFLNMVMAYQVLPSDLRARVDGLSLKHDSTTNSGGFLRHGYERPTDLAISPGTIHPLVITHPESGDRALYHAPPRQLRQPVPPPDAPYAGAGEAQGGVGTAESRVGECRPAKDGSSLVEDIQALGLRTKRLDRVFGVGQSVP
jgi:taurine dioxygenase